MKKFSVFITLTFLLSTFFVVQAFAQFQQQQQFQPFQQQQQQQQQQEMRVQKDLLGKTVMDQQGQELGKVKDVVVGTQGQPNYVIVTGKQDQLHPIPLSAVQVDPQNKQLQASISQSEFEQSPSFAENNWPNLEQPQWQQRIFSYYGQQGRQQFSPYQQQQQYDPYQQQQYDPYQEQQRRMYPQRGY